ncbi:MAG: OmpA family protein [Saprospiraceae bacterium]|nr:OmpA family protein [Saprospiraceae bacterium]
MNLNYPVNIAIAAFFLLFSIAVSAQEEESLVVNRITVIDQYSPVVHIFVDADNVKWVSNGKGVFQLRSSDLANPLALSPGEQSLYTFPGGNYDLKWSGADLNTALGNIINPTNPISAAAYDSARDELWIGTKTSGLHLLKTKPALRKVESFTTSNSKLVSNEILNIYIDKKRQRWIGTREGVMIGGDGKWRLEQRYFAIHRIAEGSNGIWVAGEGQVWQVDSRERWLAVPLNNLIAEGRVEDIAVDPKGRLWVASESIVRYDPDSDKVERFGPIEYYTSQYATCIALDQDEAVWIGTEDKGIFLIEKASAITINVLKEKELSCTPGQNDAALRVKVTGGKPPFTYRWDKDGLRGEAPAQLGPGQYSLTVTDSQGRTKTAGTTIEDTRISVRVTQQDPESAPNAGDAVALAVAEGGTPQFTYRWDNGETSNIARKLSGGNHSVTITDRNGCTAVGTVTIEQKAAALSARISPAAQLRCSGDKSGALIVEVSGGKGPFQFRWNQAGISGEKPTGLAAGAYQVNVTDAEGSTTIANFTIEAPALLTVATAVVSSATTGNKDGKANVQVSGGTSPYTYKWDNGNTGQQASALAPGMRSVTVTDANGCTATAQISITENILPLAATLNQTASISCAGAASAALEVQVSGGKGPFQYKWNQAALSGERPTGLAAGEYQVEVSDAAGNKTTANVSIKAPAALTATATAVSPASTGNSDGKANVQVSGGTSPYTYKWDNGNTGQQASALAPGMRSVTVTDANGCTATAQISITENILPLAATLNQTASIACAGTASAALEVQVSGGKGPFQYKWNQAALSGERPTGLAAGEYEVTVTDALGATKTASVTVKQPAALAADMGKKRGASSVSVADGRAAVTVSGGTPPYTYQWDNGETTDAAVRLTAGMRTVTVSDAGGCVKTLTVEISVRVLPELTAGLLQTGQAVRMEQLQFDADSIVLKPEFYPILDELYDFLDDNPGIVVEIGGHTNSLPPDEVCDRISNDRAKAVAEHLVAKGISEKRVFYKGYGKRQPIATNTTPEGRRRNQRVEVKMLQIGEED